MLIIPIAAIVVHYKLLYNMISRIDLKIFYYNELNVYE